MMCSLHTSHATCAAHMQRHRQSPVRQQRRLRHQRQQQPRQPCAAAAEQEAASPAKAPEASPERCKLCGVDLASAPRGCDNEGHVIKGLGSWPGFGWFEALRVYGPCPEAQKKGIAYTRKGDTLDEIMFGKDK